MNTVFVGIAGGIASGKNLFAQKLASRLAQKKLKAVPIKVSSARGYYDVPAGDCVIYHGLTVLDDPRFKDMLDVKVFLDIDADIRLSNLLKRGNGDMVDKYIDGRSFHSDCVMKQKKIADIWINEISNEKLSDVVNVIEKVRKEPQPTETEPVEVRVYLDKYDQRTHAQ